MFKFSLVCLMIFLAAAVSAQVKESSLFARVMHDPLNAFSADFPAQPVIDSALYSEVLNELKDDSSAYYFSYLSRDSIFTSRPPAEPTDWFFNHRRHALLMACLTHWNPETRIQAARKLTEWRKIRPMICTTRENYERIDKQDQRILKHLIYVFESNPLIIPGSENATIHRIYIKDLLMAIQVYAGEPPSGESEAELLLRDGKALGQARQRWVMQLK